MGAKRAVAGRSLPYDMLLAAYQKKNQAKQQSKYPCGWIRIELKMFLVWLSGNSLESSANQILFPCYRSST
jgi:hypothetical protein